MSGEWVVMVQIALTESLVHGRCFNLLMVLFYENVVITNSFSFGVYSSCCTRRITSGRELELLF